MKVMNAKEIGGDPIRNEKSRIFVDVFYYWIKFFSKDKEVLKKAFAHMFNPDAFYVAILDDQVAGFASIYNDQIKNISLDRKQLQKHLGFFMGLAAYKILKKEFEDKQYPFEMTPQMQAIEFVASNAQYRRKGVASEIIKHIIKEDHHTVFVLEVADTNTSAVSLYKKIGFKEFMKVKMKNSKQSGVDHLIYMAYQKKASTNPNGMIAP